MNSRWPRWGLLALPLLACVLGARAADAGTEWSTFKDPEGRFSILMPGDPRVSNTTNAASGDKLGSETHDYLASKDSGFFAVGVTIYDKAAKIDVEGELAANRDNFNKAVSGKLTGQLRRSFGDYPALEFKTSSAQVNFSSLVVLVGTNCYMVVARYQTPDEPAEVTRFFQSFRLLSP